MPSDASRSRRSGRIDANESGYVKSPVRTVQISAILVTPAIFPVLPRVIKSHKQTLRRKDDGRQKGQG